jgi:nitrogenase-stabilizing/protective protein
MDTFIQRLKALSSAEDFLQFFGVPYDEPVVQVNRLHILKRFYQYLHRAEGLTGLDDVELFKRYRVMLENAYQDFVQSTPAREKVFKVFQTAGGQQHVQVSTLRDSLDGRRRNAQLAAESPTSGQHG